MAEKTSIGWTNSSVNFWIGCTKVSPGCQNCYAERLVRRWGKDFSVLRRTADSTFYAPLKWKKGRMIFTCSLSDFFHPDADKWRNDAWEVIRKTPQHTWQILTKRPERIRQCLPTDWGDGWDNVWLGVTIEKYTPTLALRTLFRYIPCKVHFISFEPLLGEVYQVPLEHIEWVIIGGESGHEFRQLDEQWIRNMIFKCNAMHIPVFYKQPAGLKPGMPAILDGKEYKAMPNR